MKLNRKIFPFLLLTSILWGEVNLNFQNMEIGDFIKMVARITGKNILVTYPIRGKVNFISVKPVKESEVYDILLSVLKSKGYTIVKDGDVLKVVRSREALKEAPPLSSRSSTLGMQTTIIPLKNISATDAYGLVNYLVSRYGKIVLNVPKNLLVVTDYPKNIRLIREIISKVDNRRKHSMEFITLKYGDAGKIYKKITDIANGLFNKKIYHYKIVSDENTNSIIIVGDAKVVAKLGRVVRRLDKKPKSPSQLTKIITLKNSDAGQVAKVLNSIIKVKFKKNPPSVTASKETNSLILVGSLKQIEMIKTIIEALDIPKQQVYVKAKILEISNSKASQIGAQYGIYAGSGTGGLYTLSANMGGPAIAFNVKDLGLSLPTLQRGLALGVTSDLLETLGAAKKLSEPSILCINNTPSTIYVGKTVSVLTGKTTSNATSESYSRQDIGLTLQITPRIDSDNKVSLKVKAVVEDILPGSVVGLPTTSKREIKTTTIVKNGQSIIIGGLVKDNKDITIKKVPILGDIPIIGALFRHKEVNNDKTTLAIILTPYIVKKSDDLDKLRDTLSKLNQLERRFVQDYLRRKKGIAVTPQEKNKKKVKVEHIDILDGY
jgi:general secretion pathway protein D